MISIIIPTLNEEKVLEKTLLALRKLISTPFEIIISDGGSRDDTLNIARKYAHKVVECEKGVKQTIALGRNLGAKYSNGDMLVFLDADVEIPEINTFFETAVNKFENQKNLVGLSVFLKVFPQHATLSDKLFFKLVNYIHYTANHLLPLGSASGEFQMITRQAFLAAGGYRTDLAVGEDVEMFSRLRKLGKTRIEAGLHVLHTGRRAHAVGWGKLWYLWIKNNLIFIKLFNRSFTKEWTAIR
ncbi:MAG: glycosyltransferase [Candidatus Doudnabacteria bacterium]|nr:glycosyltransferase [Candidatus Doudnabacteria bacterium]